MPFQEEFLATNTTLTTFCVHQACAFQRRLTRPLTAEFHGQDSPRSGSSINRQPRWCYCTSCRLVNLMGFWSRKSPLDEFLSCANWPSLARSTGQSLFVFSGGWFGFFQATWEKCICTMLQSKRIPSKWPGYIMISYRNPKLSIRWNSRSLWPCEWHMRNMCSSHGPHASFAIQTWLMRFDPSETGH